MSNNKINHTQEDIKERSENFRETRTGRAKDYFDRTFKQLIMKYGNTRLGQNFELLQKYKKIYYHLIENELPILKGGERK